jgi:hypothetical protein
MCAMAMVIGCDRGPTRIAPPDWDATLVSERLFDAYDKDQNGFITVEEMKNCPAIESSIATIDQDGNKEVSLAELSDAIRPFEESRIGMITPAFFIRMNGRPLPGARVYLRPDPSVEDIIEPADAVSDRQGMAVPSVSADSLPNPRIRGIRPGIYRVEVSLEAGGKERVPAYYNTQSSLGLFAPPNMLDTHVINLTD